MDVLGWLWWLILKALALAWSLVWLLLGGWVATLAQVAVIVLAVFAYKYGWRRAPQEVALRARPLAAMLWRWLRGRENAPSPAPQAEPKASKVRTSSGRRSRRGFVGAVSLSTLLNLLLLTGLGLLVVL